MDRDDITWIAGYPFRPNKPWGIFLYKLSRESMFCNDLSYARLYVLYRQGNRSLKK